MYSSDFRWRAVVLSYVYGISNEDISFVLGLSPRTVRRWCHFFETNGVVEKEMRAEKSSRFSPEVLTYINKYVAENPCFFLDELIDDIKSTYKISTSTATVCRALRFDLNLTRKVLEKRARQIIPGII